MLEPEQRWSVFRPHQLQSRHSHRVGAQNLTRPKSSVDQLHLLDRFDVLLHHAEHDITGAAH
jgi:hypothetical protein